MDREWIDLKINCQQIGKEIRFAPSRFTAQSYNGFLHSIGSQFFSIPLFLKKEVRQS